MSATKPALPEPVALIDPRGLAIGAASMHCIKRPEYRSAADAYAGVEYVSVYTADQLRAYGDARAAEAIEWRDAAQEELRLCQQDAIALQREVEALRKDAERWRWLRANFGAIVVDTEWRGGPAEGRYVRSVTLNPLLGPTEPASIDAAIDAALQEQKS